MCRIWAGRKGEEVRHVAVLSCPTALVRSPLRDLMDSDAGQLPGPDVPD